MDFYSYIFSMVNAFSRLIFSENEHIQNKFTMIHDLLGLGLENIVGIYFWTTQSMC